VARHYVQRTAVVMSVAQDLASVKMTRQVEFQKSHLTTSKISTR